MIGLDASAAWWFLPFALPICLFAAYSDLSRMRLPNVMVLALVAVYVVIGFVALPLDQYLWGYVHLALMYVVGIVAFAYLGVGAGDGKFAAAMSMFIPVVDLTIVLTLFCVFLLVAFATHRTFRAIPAVRRMTPDWASWSHAKFPMGLALSGTFIAYLGIAASV